MLKTAIQKVKNSVLTQILLKNHKEKDKGYNLNQIFLVSQFWKTWSYDKKKWVTSKNGVGSEY